MGYEGPALSTADGPEAMGKHLELDAPEVPHLVKAPNESVLRLQSPRELVTTKVLMPTCGVHF